MTKTKTEQLNELFVEWEKARPYYKEKFVKDGIINEKVYEKTTPKILFIAKEPNQKDSPKAFDFREFWKDEIEHPFSYRVAEWAYGMLNKFPPFDNIYGLEDWNNTYRDALHSIAFMDIKKSGGKGKADHSTILKHINENKDLILEEIRIINPEIIVSGLVDKELVTSLFDVAEEHWKKTGYVRCVFKWNNCKVIDFYHPSSQTAPAASYSLLQNIVRSEAFKNL